MIRSSRKPGACCCDVAPIAVTSTSALFICTSIARTWSERSTPPTVRPGADVPVVTRIAICCYSLLLGPDLLVDSPIDVAPGSLRACVEDENREDAAQQLSPSGLRVNLVAGGALNRQVLHQPTKAPVRLDRGLHRV